LKKYGFSVKRIIITGSGKKDAVLKFDTGLNVISGASDTGKTYVFEALNYMMGSGEIPKEVEEGKGYQEVFLEIEDINKNIYTIKRNLSDGKMFIYECTYENRNNKTPLKIIEKHDVKDKNNISSFLLELCKSEYKSVVKSLKTGSVESFTFRDFARLIMLSEEKIISKKSVILGNVGPVKYTKYKNSFKTIVTGIEDEGIKSEEDKKISKITLDAKIEMMDNLITKYTEDLKELNTNFSSVGSDINELEAVINEIEEIINNKKQILEDIEDKRKLLLNEQRENTTILEYNIEVIKKFSLLKENYLSDLQRIEFVDEANYYINQLDNVKCPVCLSSIEKESNIDIKSISISIIAEKNKLEKQLNEIDETISILEEKNENIKLKNREIIAKVDELTLRANTELKPIIELKLNELKNFLKGRDILNEKEYIESKLLEIEQIRTDLIKKKRNIKIEKIEIHELNNTNINDICKMVSSLLIEWKLFSGPVVEFNVKDFDFIINGKKKESFGKGYRAIINSALVIAIMKYTVDRGLPHPKLIILDSPLTTFKEKDKDGNKDEVDDMVKKSFYNHLANNFSNEQIIVFENVEPDSQIKGKITYYHFSKNKNNGRYGFFWI
jgi:hypothetical protein